MTTKNPFQKIEELLKEIRDIVADGEYIFRGEPIKNDEVSSNLYREFKTAMKAEHFDINVVQEEILRNVKKHTKVKDNDTILEQLQHFGGKTNQIDFTTDYLIALFFACDGGHREDGRLIFLGKEKFKEQIHEPTHPENRVIAQKSIFVRPPTGTVEPNKEITIDKELKEPIIYYLDRHHNINTQTVYNDIHGYITRHKSHKSAYTDFYIGWIYQNEQKNDLAIEHYTKALDDQKIPEAYTNRGNVYYDKGDYDKAFSDYNKAIELNPNYANAYINRGSVYSKKGDYDKGISDYDKAIALNPNDATMAYFNRGNVYDDKGDYDKAISDYNKAIELNPNYVDAYINRGSVYDKKGDHDKAISDYDKAIALNPNYATAYFNRGNVYDGKSDYDKAISDYDKAITLNPDYASAYINRGSVYNKKGDHDKSISDYDKGIALSPNNALAYNNRGNAYNDKGDYDKAITDLNKAIELNLNYALAYNNRGNTYKNKGDYDKAIYDFDKAITLNPNYAKTYANRAISKKALQDYKGAKQDFQTTLKLVEQQGEKNIAGYIKKAIAALPPDS